MTAPNDPLTPDERAKLTTREQEIREEWAREQVLSELAALMDVSAEPAALEDPRPDPPLEDAPPEPPIDIATARASRSQAADGVELYTVAMASIVMRPLTFLWPGFVVEEEINVLFGPGKRGKGQIAAAISAHVTGGPRLPGAPECAGGVIWMGAEDSIDRVVVPRLRVAQANPEHVRFIKAKRTVAKPRDGEPDNFDCLPQIARDAAQLIAATRGARLLVIDPLASFIDTDVDSHKDAEVRRVMSTLQQVAEVNHLTILAIAHANKRSEGGVNQRLGGSVGIYNAARSVLVVDKDPDQEDVRVLAAADGNHGPGRDALQFTFESAELNEPSTGAKITTSRVVWGSDVKISADDLVAGGKARASSRVTKEDRLQGEEALVEWLQLQPRGVTEAEIVAALTASGAFNRQTIDAAIKQVLRKQLVDVDSTAGRRRLAYRRGGKPSPKPTEGAPF